jgi:small subunit ribosomal protein S7
MIRKKLIKKILPQSNFIYNNILTTILINKILKNGKKSLAKKIVHNIFNYILIKTNKNPQIIFEQAIRNICPRVKLKTNKIGGANYQIPVLVNLFNGINYAIRWLIEISKKKTGKQIYLKIATEILEAAKGQGNTIKKKEDIHKLAKANKAFLLIN